MNKKMSLSLETFFISTFLLIIFQVVLATSEESTVAPKIQFEAAFQGKCGVESPCQHVCFELHDGMFECDCRPGYILLPDGYSCQEMNATVEPGFEEEEGEEGEGLGGEGDEEDDILYQKDASFSAHLDLSNLLVSPSTSDLLDETTPPPQDNVHFVPVGGATFAPLQPPCLLDCSVGVCSNIPANTDNLSTQRCQCPLGRTGTHCETEVTEPLRVARFSGQSFLAFPALRGAYKDVQVSLEFRPESADGVLLLAAERDDMAGDFLALVLVDSYVEFRFDCGSGQGGVRSPEPVQLHQWNRLTLYRHRWDAWLQLNGGKHVQGRSKGLFSRITFREPLFVGGPGNTTGLAAKLGAAGGLRGCVRHLELNDHVYSFGLAPRGDAAQGFDVEECSSDACSRLSCQHGGKCVSAGDSVAVTAGAVPAAMEAACLCPLGYSGPVCEQRVELQVPSFNGSSYLRYEGLGAGALSWLELRLVFKPDAPDGLLLYNGGRADGVGDFASLSLVGGHLEFSFDLGTGPATVRSHALVSLHTWHEVLVSRTGRLAWLQVDTQPPSHAATPGAFTQLLLPQSLYLGGAPNLDMVSPKARARASFVGCVQKLEVNSRPVRLLASALSGVNVANCAHPCAARPCNNGGHCVPDRERFSCECVHGYRDVHCGTPPPTPPAPHHAANLLGGEPGEPVPRFSGHSYLHFTDQETLRRIVSNKLNINMRFRTRAAGGLLLWSGRRGEGGGDSLALGVRQGVLELHFNLGSGEVALQYNATRVDDGLWHRVKAIRSEQEGALIVDNGPLVTQRSPGRLRQLNTDTGLYIGGVEEQSGQSWPGLVGCVSDLTLDGDYHVPLVHGAASGRNIDHCG